MSEEETAPAARGECSATKRRIRGFPNKLSVSHTGLDFIHMFMCSYRAVSKSSILDKQEVTAGLT